MEVKKKKRVVQDWKDNDDLANTINPNTGSEGAMVLMAAHNHRPFFPEATTI